MQSRFAKKALMAEVKGDTDYYRVVVGSFKSEADARNYKAEVEGKHSIPLFLKTVKS